MKLIIPKIRWHTAKAEANTRAGRLLRSTEKRMNAAQGGTVSRRII